MTLGAHNYKIFLKSLNDMSVNVATNAMRIYFDMLHDNERRGMDKVDKTAYVKYSMIFYVEF